MQALYYVYNIPVYNTCIQLCIQYTNIQFTAVYNIPVFNILAISDKVLASSWLHLLILLKCHTFIIFECTCTKGLVHLYEFTVLFHQPELSCQMFWL